MASPHVAGAAALVSPDERAAVAIQRHDGRVLTSGLIEVQPDDGFFVSSWETSTVYHVTASGEVHEIITGVPSPADIGYDARRNRILIPVFMENRLEFHPLPY